jgi:superfamily II DNA/RNA helicase
MTSFSDLGLSPEVVKAVTDAGYDTPTPIQEQAIPIALAGRDVLGIAQTGTGKTAAFTLPMIDRLAAGRAKARMPRALVIAPTRELADQVSASFEKYAKGRSLSWALLIGGVSFADQVRKLDRGVDVLIATPGRLLDHFERGKLLLTGVQMMVVDEADRMLDMGFIPDIERIFKMTPPKKQTLFFSATMPPEITRLTAQFLNEPVRIEASRPATTAENITQYLVRIPSSDPKAKRVALRALMGRDDVKNGIVFCNRKSEVDVVAKSLRTHGFDASPIHGDLDQSMRMKTLADFRSGALRLLVASDVAARGLDIPDVSHVFNYDVPHHADDYVHRIGRTGRAGKSGQTFMLVTPNDGRQLDKVLKLIGKVPNELTLDIDFSEIKSEPRESSRSSARGRPEGRGRERDRKPPRVRPEDEAPREPLTVIEPRAETADASSEQPARAERPPRERGPRRRGRGERPDREARPEHEARPEGEARPERAEQPEREARPEREPRPERPEREARSERPEREARPARAEAAEASEAPVRRERRPEPARGDNRPRREDDSARRGPPQRDRDDDRGERGVVGFGSDVPAFLQRAPAKTRED